MRIVAMVTRDWHNPAASGGDIVVCEYMRFLASRGHQVTVLVSSFPGGKNRAVSDGVTIIRLGTIPLLWIRTFIYYMKHFRKRCDIVIEEAFGGSRIPRFASVYVVEPILVEWHQVHHDLFTAQYNRLIALFLDLLERFTCLLHRKCYVRINVEDWRIRFVRLGFRNERLVVLPPMLDLPTVKSDSVREQLVVWLGKFRRYKVPHQVILAMRSISRCVPESKLVLMGRHDDLRYEEHLKRLVVSKGIGDKVCFRFNVSEEEKFKLLSKAKVLVLPSSVEGFGLVVLEANVVGVPVVASDRVPPSVVVEGLNGLRFPYGDIAALSECVVSILKDENLFNKLSKQAKFFASRFSREEIGLRYENLLVNIITERQRSSARVHYWPNL